jgi:hypothetical protein
MSLLGSGGSLIFSRPPREVLILRSEDRREQSQTFQVSGHNLWSGDFVELTPEDGHPLSPFYATCFVHVDRLRRLSLYTTKQEAVIGHAASRMPLPEPEHCPISLHPIDGDYEVKTEIEDWTLHTDAVYLNESLVERQLGTGALSLCACGGQLSFTYEARSPKAFIHDTLLISNLLENGDTINASFTIDYDYKHQLSYSLNLTPLAYVLNYRALPRIDGTLDFSSNNLPALRQV